MAKHVRKQVDRQGQDVRAITVQIPMPVLGVLVDAREAFYDLCVETGQQALGAMMEADREALCGPKGRQVPARRACRGGSTRSWITLGGRQIRIPRLRARGAEGELELPSFAWAADRDPLDCHTLTAVAAGVSSRKYPRILERLCGEVSERSTSRSAVSRRFVALTTRQMHAFLARSLEDLELRAIMIDGKVFRDHCLLIALGIDVDGKKHVLGLREGTTENSRVARALLSDLVARGLRTDRARVFVIAAQSSAPS